MSTSAASDARPSRSDPATVPEVEAAPPSARGLVSLLTPEATYVAMAALSATVAAALALVPFFVVARMAPAIYRQPADLEAVRSLALLAAAALVVRYAFVAGANVFAHVAAFRILHDLRLRLAKKLGAVPLSFFGRRSAGELRKTLLDDVNAIEAFVAHNFPDAVAAVVVPTSTAIALLWVDWRMTLASVVMAPVAVFVMSVAMRGVGKAHVEWNGLQTRMNAALLEYLRGIPVIKTSGLTAQRFGDLSRTMDEGLAWMVGFMRTNGRGYGAFGSIIGSSLVVLVPVGGWLFARGALSLETLVLFLVLGPQLLMSLMRLMFAWGNIDRIKGANTRIHEILEAHDLERTAGGTGPFHAGISFRNASFRYSDDGPEVLHGVSFDVAAGKVTALVGPSGAGKTTLMRLVPRLWDTSGGSVRVGGVDVTTLPLDALLSQISMVFQDVFLFHGSVNDNLRLAKSDATDEQVHAACRAARAHDFIQALPQGYDTVLGERGARLSGGEKQRLSIARALLADAPILLLDEATAFADPENEARIQEALSELCVGRTVLVVAHRLSSIASADHIVVLDHGRVEDQGTHDELLERCPLYQRLWASHTAALGWSFASNTVEVA